MENQFNTFLRLLVLSFLFFNFVGLSGCVGKVTGTVQSTKSDLKLATSFIALSVEQSYAFEVDSANGVASFSIYSGDGIVTSEGQFTAPTSAGTTIVKVSDEQEQISFITVEVYDRPILSGPKEILITGESSFFVANGKPPYTFAVIVDGSNTAGIIDTNFGKFTAPNTPGNNTIRVTDSLGASASLDISINSNLAFTQGSFDILQGATSEPIVVSGGVGTSYKYRLIGAGYFDPTTLRFTASNTISSSILNVTDEAGNSASILLNTTTGTTWNDLTVTPVRSTLNVGEQVQLAVEGGSSLTYQLISGGGSISSGGLFTAPTSGGTSVIKVTDGLGHSGLVTIETKGNLSVSLDGSTFTQNSVELQPGGSLNLAISGGVEPVKVAAGIGVISGSGPYVYTAPSVAGIDVITIQDGNNVLTNYYVLINEGLKILPAKIHLQKNDRLQFFATGGKAPYVYSIESGGGTIDEAGLFTAPDAASTVVVKVIDSLAQQTTASVTVLESLSVNPFYKVLSVNKVQEFKISGGVAPYSVILQSGAGKFCQSLSSPLAESLCDRDDLSLSESQFGFKSTLAQSAAAIEITDANGNKVTVNLQINGPLALASSVSSFALGEKALLTASGGVPPYTLSLSSTTVAEVMQKSANSWDLLGLSSGSVIATVTDAEGATAVSNSMTVTLGAPMAQLNSLPALVSNQTSLNIFVSGQYLTHYRFAIIAADSSSTCAAATYSSAIAVATAITADISNLTNYPDGLMKVCVLGVNQASVEQSANSATTYSWTKETVGPTAVLTGAPTGISLTATTNIAVSGTGVTLYKYQIANGIQASDCVGSYSSEFSVNVPLTASVVGDGSKVVCVLAKGQVVWQSQPTVVTWTADFSGPLLADTVNDGSFSNSLSASNVLTYTLGTDDISAVSSHEVRVMQGATVIQDWVTHTQGTALSGLSLAHGQTYSVEVRAKNQLGLYSMVRQSNGWLVDTQAPSTPSNLALGTPPLSLVQTPTLTWDGSTDATSGLLGYQVQIWSDEATDVLVKDWTSLSSGSAITSGVTLTGFVNYYFKLRAVDMAGNASASVNSLSWMAEDSDPYWANVQTMAHFDGTDNSTTFTNQKASTLVTQFGTPLIKTDNSRFGGASLFLNGSSAVRSNAPNVNWGTQDFTIEYWLYKTSNSVGGNGHVRAFSVQTGAVGEYYAVMKGFNDGNLMFSFNGGCTVIAQFALNTWTHVAVSRNGSTFRMFFDGIEVSTCTSSAPINVNNYATLGSYWDGGEFWPGYIDEYRLTVGVGRYTSNFTVRTGPFPHQ